MILEKHATLMKIILIELNENIQPHIHTCTPLTFMVKINESPKSDVYNFINV
jgi:hypothetical protein